MFVLDWETLYILSGSAAGIATILILSYLIRQDWPRSKGVDITVWAVIGAIAGAIIGLADNDIKPSSAILMGAVWGGLIALVKTSGWSLRNK
ncbi:MAG: hypothetical protein H6632_04135 [Anaerolineales bacterium]|nr:hypothetical protein [Anaerolineales bacterium]